MKLTYFFLLKKPLHENLLKSFPCNLYDVIKLLSQRKLDCFADIISQAVQDGDNSSIEFHKVLKEVEKYCKLKADIRNLAKTKVRQITKEQREELLELGRKEGKENLLQKIANISNIHGVSAI